MANQEKHLSNYRSAQQRVNAASVFKVPGSNQKLDSRLATEQMAALRDNLRIIEMRISKAIKAGNQTKVDALSNLRDRQQGHIQRVADAINEQWSRDDKWLASNADRGTFQTSSGRTVGAMLAQPYYRNGVERSEALALASKAK